jgi:hypothetical protein
MPEGWLLLQIGRNLEIAIEPAWVYRLLHRQAREYAEYAPIARALDRAFSQALDRSQPGIIVVLADGACWYVGDAILVDSRNGLSYLSVSPDLFGNRTPWCRGVLYGEGHWAYVADKEGLEAAIA